MTRCKRCGENVRTLGDYLGEGMCNACFRGDRCARELIAEWWDVLVGTSIVARRSKRVDAQWYARGLKGPIRVVHVRRYKVVR